MDENISETNLQAFVRALHEAYGASQAVDHYDLRSEDDTSVQGWEILLKAQRDAFRELHTVCGRVSIADLSV